VKTRTVSFREIQDAHKKERAEDSRALRAGTISAAELQARNSFLPVDAPMQIVDLGGYLKNRRRSR
jgi:hypothetical protein